MTKLLDSWERYMRAANFTPDTIKLRRCHVARLLRDLATPVDQITTDQLSDWLAGHEWSPATRRSYRASIQSFFRYTHRTGDTDDIAKDLPAARVPRSLPRPAADTVITAALRQADERVQLMIELMAYGGLRRGEVCKVKAGDLQGEWLTVTGKGGHTRVVPLPPHLCRRIRRHAGWLFPGAIDGHLSARRVGELVSEVLPRGITAHSLRHRYATTTYTGSKDIRAVQSLLGHAKLDTTMVYVKVSSEDQHRAAATAWRLTS